MQRIANAFTTSIAIAAFVLCWGSGYMAARFTVNYFEPFNLLLVRYIGTTLVLFAIVLFIHGRQTVKVIRSEHVSLHVFLGFLYHVAYIGCVFYAVKMGLSAGITAVILATQPLATLLLESVASIRWPARRVLLGTFICFTGAVLILDDGSPSGAANDFGAIVVALIGVASISVATVLHADVAKTARLWASLLIQFAAGTVTVALLLVCGFEETSIRLTHESTLFVVFLIFFTTLGSYVLISWLLRNIPTTLYANIFYLVPPTVMLAEFFWYGEQVTLVQVLGTAVILLGIFVGFSRLKALQVASEGDKA